MARARATAPLLLAALLLACPLRASGGEWHSNQSNVCSDCHTMHNSRAGLPMRYDGAPAGAPVLLRAGTPTGVCLACHAGQKAAAPSVTAPAGSAPGGGFPVDLADPQHRGHALQPSPALPPGGDTAVVMTCTTCHDPHGNGAYRNLRPSPSGTGRSKAAPVVLQKVVANGSNPADVYQQSNLTYLSGMSQWCMDCHNLMVAEDPAAGVAGSHSWDRTIAGAAAADGARWAGDVGRRVPVQNAAGQPAPHAADQVFCLSCHRAHGTPNPAALIWADGASLDSTCQQCHDP